MIRRRKGLRRRTALRTRGIGHPGPEREGRARNEALRIQRAHAALRGNATPWEETFLGAGNDGVRTRLERYTTAWRNPDLADEHDRQGPLSRRQRAKLKELETKGSQARASPPATQGAKAPDENKNTGRE